MEGLELGEMKVRIARYNNHMFKSFHGALIISGQLLKLMLLED